MATKSQQLEMNILAITQARSNSSRLPGKVLMTISGQTLLEMHIRRILNSKSIDKLIVATTSDISDDGIAEVAQHCGVSSYRGSENDVLDRFYRAASSHFPNWIVRLTADCPLIDPELIDHVIKNAMEGDYDYYSNCESETFPDGQDVEVFTFESLKSAWKSAELFSEREHVTPFIRKNLMLRKEELQCTDLKYKFVRLTVDEQCDFEVIEQMIKKAGLDKSWQYYADFYLEHDEISRLNRNIIRNEGYTKSIKNDKKTNG